MQHSLEFVDGLWHTSSIPLTYPVSTATMAAARTAPCGMSSLVAPGSRQSSFVPTARAYSTSRQVAPLHARCSLHDIVACSAAPCSRQSPRNHPGSTGTTHDRNNFGAPPAHLSMHDGGRLRIRCLPFQSSSLGSPFSSVVHRLDCGGRRWS
jgi:hypothetical protein